MREEEGEERKVKFDLHQFVPPGAFFFSCSANFFRLKLSLLILKISPSRQRIPPYDLNKIGVVSLSAATLSPC
jgi:hypothetical protein